jgi:hypothetical protein
MQGKRRSGATLDLIRFVGLKLSLTMRIYCDKRAAPEGGFVGEPSKSHRFIGRGAGLCRSYIVSAN